MPEPERQRDRPPAVGLDEKLGASVGASLDLADDGEGVLVARIVRRQHDDVG